MNTEPIQPTVKNPPDKFAGRVTQGTARFGHRDGTASATRSRASS